MAAIDNRHVAGTSCDLQCLQHIFENISFDCECLQDKLANTRVEDLDDSDNIIEERTSVRDLKLQFQIMQNKISEQNNILLESKQMYEKMLLDRENEIFNLKHRINEELEDKNKLIAQNSDNTSRLNNEINELEQKIKDNYNNSKKIIETKMKDIQILQEQKLSLLQSLTNEITKLNNIIINLKTDIEKEQKSRLDIKERYENKLMKLNEKVLNRNNELVELQDGIFEKGETIENLQMELRKEKECAKKFHNNMLRLQQEKTELEKTCQMKLEEMKHNYEQRIATLANNSENCELICRNENDSKKQFDTESRKRLPLQDFSNFNNNQVSYSKGEKYNIYISPN